MAAIFNPIKATSLPTSPAPHSIYFIKGGSDVRIKGYLTDANGTAFPLGIIDEQDVLGVTLEGFTVGSDTPINSTNSIFNAFRNIQGQLNTLSSAVAGGIKIPLPLDASTNPNYPPAQAGDSYLVTVAGRIGGASGPLVQVGDKIVAKQTNAGGNQATVGSAWFILQANIDSATTEVQGITRIATDTEVNAGSENFAYVTPATLRGGVRNTTLTGYAVGANSAIAATDNVLQAFGKVQGQINARAVLGTGANEVRNNTQLDARYQAILTNPVTGTGANTQVSFWTGTDTQSGDERFTWDNNLKAIALIQGDIIAEIGRVSFRIASTERSFISANRTIAGGQLSNLNFGTSGALRWQILEDGLLQSNGAQGIQTSGTEALTLQGNGGDVVYNPSNGTGDIMTIASGNQLRRRTPSQILTDIGAQPLLTNPITGSGTRTENFVPKFASNTNQILNSQIFDNGTNVGLGITSPSQKLHVGSTAAGDISVLVSTASASFAQYRLQSGSTDPWIIGTQDTFLSNSLVFRNVSDRMVISTSGNVGIGTDSPSARLDIDGNARIRTLATAQGDFVQADSNGLLSRRTTAQVREQVVTWTETQW